MRALALAMLLSLSAGPLMAGPRGGHNNGDEILDLVDGPGTDYFGDPDDGVGFHYWRTSTYQPVSWFLDYIVRRLSRTDVTHALTSASLRAGTTDASTRASRRPQ